MTESDRALQALVGDSADRPIKDEEWDLSSITIVPGVDKSGKPEAHEQITMQKGEVVCIVGPTGSGKSRLLADIEWLARADTPTRRTILINGREPDPDARYTGNRLVAQLSQNMNFVMDVAVREFLELHAQSRGIDMDEARVGDVILAANELAGEPLSGDSQLTELSGGQSRALMIADTALLSSSPIVLIDEIENAGIDRTQAIELLRGAEKIVLAATHDPALALLAQRRIVIANGGIRSVQARSPAEEELARRLSVRDEFSRSLRNALRTGGDLDSFLDPSRWAPSECP